MAFFANYEYRLYPTRCQTAVLLTMFDDFRTLYNAALQQREEAWSRQKVSLSYEDQANELKAIREACTEQARWSYTAQQQMLRRIKRDL